MTDIDIVRAAREFVRRQEEWMTGETTPRGPVTLAYFALVEAVVRTEPSKK